MWRVAVALGSVEILKGALALLFPVDDAPYTYNCVIFALKCNRNGIFKAMLNSFY